MKLSEMLDEIMVRTGQFILGDISTFGLSYNLLWPLVKRELTIYQRYIPYVKSFQVTALADTPYDFTLDQNNLGFSNADLNNIVYGPPPIAIQKFGPIRDLFQVNIMNFQFWNRFGQRRIGDPNNTRDPYMVLREYRRPFIFTTTDGSFDCTALYNYHPVITYTVDDDNKPTKTISDVCIQGLGDGTNEDPESVEILIEMVAAQFLLAVGRSRRAFTHSDLIITTDAATLVTEAAQMYKDARESLETQSSWWRGITI